MKANSINSALTEKDGINKPPNISSSSVAVIQKMRKKQPSAQELIDKIVTHDKSALSRAITLVESTNPAHLDKANTIIQSCLP